MMAKNRKTHQLSKANKNSLRLNFVSTVKVVLF